MGGPKLPSKSHFWLCKSSILETPLIQNVLSGSYQKKSEILSAPITVQPSSILDCSSIPPTPAPELEGIKGTLDKWGLALAVAPIKAVCLIGCAGLCWYKAQTLSKPRPPPSLCSRWDHHSPSALVGWCPGAALSIVTSWGRAGHSPWHSPCPWLCWHILGWDLTAFPGWDLHIWA